MAMGMGILWLYASMVGIANQLRSDKGRRNDISDTRECAGHTHASVLWLQLVRQHMGMGGIQTWIIYKGVYIAVLEV